MLCEESTGVGLELRVHVCAEGLIVRVCPRVRADRFTRSSVTAVDRCMRKLDDIFFQPYVVYTHT